MIVGCDASLTCTGIAVVGTNEDVAEVLSVRSIKTHARENDDTEPLALRADRVMRAAGQFAEVMDEVDGWARAGEGGFYAGSGILLVVETRDFQTPRDQGGSAFDRAWLLGQFITTARAYRAVVAGVSPSTLKVFATGRGGRDVKKAHVIEAVERRYSVPVANGDEADALTLAAMGAAAVGAPLVDPEPYARALKAVRWPVNQPPRQGDHP